MKRVWVQVWYDPKKDFELRAYEGLGSKVLGHLIHPWDEATREREQLGLTIAAFIEEELWYESLRQR